MWRAREAEGEKRVRKKIQSFPPKKKIQNTNPQHSKKKILQKNRNKTTEKNVGTKKKKNPNAKPQKLKKKIPWKMPPHKEKKKRNKKKETKKKKKRKEKMHTGTDEVPVLVIRGELLVGASLDQVDPLGEGQQTRPLQVLGILLDEKVSGNILDGGSSADTGLTLDFGHLRFCWFW